MDKQLWVTAPVENLNIEKYRNYIVPEYIRENIEEWGWGDAVAFESAETGRKYTHYQVLENSKVFAGGLIKSTELGLKRGDVVAVILPNVPEYASILFGIWEAGLVVTPLNPNCTEYEINGQLELSRAKVIVTMPKFLPITRSIQRENSQITKIIVVGSDGDSESETYEDCLNYFEFLQSADTNGVDFFTGSQITADNDVALLPFSSGTSGLPKAVMLTHYGLLSNFIVYTQGVVCPTNKFEGGNPQDRQIAVLPFFHVFGIVCNMGGALLQGAHVLTMGVFNPSLFIQKLQDFKPTVLFLVPTLVSFIANTDSIGLKELGQLRTICCAAAPAGETLIKKLKDKAKNSAYIEGYGLTEVSGALTMTRFERIGSIGQPFPEMTLKVVDITTGQTVGVGEKGELCAKSPSMMKGYLHNIQATSECIDEEGWFHTGDVAHYDEAGCFFIVDRLKELIKVKGFQVAPSELEDLIRGHAKVADVGVIGVPDDISGEVPRAYVVAKRGSLTENDIVGFVHGKVSSYKRLRGGVQIVTEIPKGGSGKILRRVLKDSYALLKTDTETDNVK